MSIESLTELLFNPFELNSDDHYSPMFDIDPDMNYYNELDSHIALNCKYHFEESIAAAISDKTEGKEHNNVFSLCHANIRSLRANLPAFEVCLQNMDIKFSAIGISEIWLNDSNCDLYNINGYDFVETHRSVKTGGGVGNFIRNNIPFQIRNDLNIHYEFCESIFIEIDKDIFDKKKNIIMAVIYRPPGSDIKVFNEIFYELLNKIKKENNLIYLIGDYNINLLNYGKHNETNEFVDMLHASSFISLINCPTRVQKESATLIDNIFYQQSLQARSNVPRLNIY